MYDVFEQLLQRDNITTYKVAKATGIAQSVFTAWKKGESKPKYDKLKKIANYFGVSVEYLVGKKDGQDISNNASYYTNEETATLAQEMFDDPDLRALHHMKRNMNPESFKANIDMMKRMYRLEHPEDDAFEGC